ncbi:hypothetical protein F8388_007751 [Cannabis sativa]|uniref:Fe2OG dioxygenase domain-containing protein n=1 Tax=Cannabis sativa TaxID=3483 RepID=A0A7J6FT40_CANSA|nr:hypothetical protein F8388_007751 [Cannabis sativa]
MDFESPNVVVPSVQELAKDPNVVTVPQRYIRYDQTQIQTNSSSVISSDQKIPVIDFQNLLLDNSELYESELNKLHSACKEWGFFQLVNHGVSNSLVEKLKQGVEELFKLPIEEKKKLWRKQGDKEGFGDPGVLTDEQILDWKDVLFLFTLPVALRNPHLFPNISPLLSIHCYPPCLQPEQVEGIAPHSDSTGITFLLQLNQVEGFQVKKDGMWVPVKPLPDAFIVNIGDLLEHRAIVNSTDERMSIATFLNSNEDCEIGPSHSLITQQNPAIYKTMSSKDYIKSMFSREYNGKSHIDAFKL